MTVEVVCPQCSKSYKVRPEYAGKKVRCNNCQTSFRAAPVSDAKSDIARLPEERPPDNDAFSVTSAEAAPANQAVKPPLAVAGNRTFRFLGGCAIAYAVLLVIGFLIPRIGLLVMLCVGLMGIGLMLYGFGSFFMALERGQRFWMAAKILLRFVGFKLIYFDAALWNSRTKRALGFMFGGLGVVMAGVFPAGTMAKLAAKTDKAVQQDNQANVSRPPAGFPGSPPPPLGFPGEMPPGAFPGSQPPFMPPVPPQNVRPRDPPINSLEQALTWLGADDAKKSGPAARYLANYRVVREHQASASMVAEKLLNEWELCWDVPADFFQLLHRWVTPEQVPRLGAMVKLVSPDERSRIYSCLMKVNSLAAAEVLEKQLREALELKTHEGNILALSALNPLCEMSAAEPVLLRWAGHPDSLVYIRVLHSLGRFGTAETKAKLEQLAGSTKDPSVRSSTYSAIRSIERRLQKSAEGSD